MCLNFQIFFSFFFFFQGLGNNQREYEKHVLLYSIRNQLRFRNNLGEHLHHWACVEAITLALKGNNCPLRPEGRKMHNMPKGSIIWWHCSTVQVSTVNHPRGGSHLWKKQQTMNLFCLKTIKLSVHRFITSSIRAYRVALCPTPHHTSPPPAHNTTFTQLHAVYVHSTEHPKMCRLEVVPQGKMFSHWLLRSWNLSSQ